MSEYHITEYGRQKILKEVVMRAQKLVIDMMWYVKSNFNYAQSHNFLQEQYSIDSTGNQGTHREYHDPIPIKQAFEIQG
jgi:hypothetical protein